jgi:hypothetical protein
LRQKSASPLPSIDRAIHQLQRFRTAIGDTDNLDENALYRLQANLRDHQPVFDRTGGLHAAALSENTPACGGLVPPPVGRHRRTYLHLLHSTAFRFLQLLHPDSFHVRVHTSAGTYFGTAPCIRQDWASVQIAAHQSQARLFCGRGIPGQFVGGLGRCILPRRVSRRRDPALGGDRWGVSAVHKQPCTGRLRAKGGAAGFAGVFNWDHVGIIGGALQTPHG